MNTIGTTEAQRHGDAQERLRALCASVALITN